VLQQSIRGSTIVQVHERFGAQIFAKNAVFAKSVKGRRVFLIG